MFHSIALHARRTHIHFANIAFFLIGLHLFPFSIFPRTHAVISAEECAEMALVAKSESVGNL